MNYSAHVVNLKRPDVSNCKAAAPHSYQQGDLQGSVFHFWKCKISAINVQYQISSQSIRAGSRDGLNSNSKYFCSFKWLSVKLGKLHECDILCTLWAKGVQQVEPGTYSGYCSLLQPSYRPHDEWELFTFLEHLNSQASHSIICSGRRTHMFNAAGLRNTLSLWRWHFLECISRRLKDNILRLPLFGKTILSGDWSLCVAVGLHCLSDWCQSAWRWRGSWANCLLPPTTSTTLSVTFVPSCSPARSAQDRMPREGLDRIRRETARIFLLGWYLLTFLSSGCPNVLLENFKRWWRIHGGTFSEHEPESKLYQSQNALISLIGVKPAVWKGPVRLGPNQTWGIRSDSLSSGPKQTETEKMPRWSTHYWAEQKHI